MLTQTQTKVLDLLDYTLKVIEYYDKSYNEFVEAESKGKLTQAKGGESQTVQDRMDDVKTSFKQLAVFQAERGTEFVKTSAAYQYADSYVNFQMQYNCTINTSKRWFDLFNTQVVLPVTKGCQIVIDFSTQKISLLVEGVSAHYVTQQIIKFYNIRRAELTKNWMRLDLDNDGTVTMADFYLMLKTLRNLLSDNTMVKWTAKIETQLRERAVTLWNRRISPEEAEKPVENADDGDHSTESAESQNVEVN